MNLESSSREELVQEIRRLKRRIDRLEGGSAGQMRSIVGLDEKVIQLNEDDNIEYANRSLAKLAGVDRTEVIGQHLSYLDRFAWGEGLLMKLLAACRAEGGEVNEEVTLLDEETGRPTYHNIRCSITHGKPQILIEDLTTTKVLENTFKRYVSPAVIERMVQVQGDKDFFAADRQVITVLFADLRGFTSMSEGMDPELVRNTINEYLTAMTDAILRHEGTLDKFVGDEVMALFGAPIYYDDHAIRALKVGLDMQEAHRNLMAKWRSEGRPTPGVGIGINTGEMVVGNMGSPQRVDYSVLGHHVNLAARLCGLAQAGEVLLGEQTFAIVQDCAKTGRLDIQRNLKFKRKGNINAKGISKPVGIISVIEKEYENVAV